MRAESALDHTKNMMMTHVFRCIDAVFTALPNICMLCCNRGTINQARSLETHTRKITGENCHFHAMQHHPWLSTKNFIFSFGTKPLLMVILLFFCSCNFAKKVETFLLLSFCTPIFTLMEFFGGFFQMQYKGASLKPIVFGYILQ